MTSAPNDDETRTAPPRSSTAASPKSAEGPELVSPATAIGRFSVLGLVGSGGMGQVYSAYDPQLDRRVALKLLPHRGNDRERDRLIREARALARLAHPNVVAVHDVGEHNDRLFIAMEFVEGQTLKDWAFDKPPGGQERLARALELLRDAGRGLEAAHRASLVHRDVKPKNILVGDDRRVRVVDFGLARTEGGKVDERDLAQTHRSVDERELDGAHVDETITATGHAIGTPAYMAPEQFAGGTVDSATDQFGFCVTAWEVLFGVRPFEAGDEREALAAIRKGAATRPPEIQIPQAVEAALRKGFSYRSSARHPDFSRLCRVFDEALAVEDRSAARRSRRRAAVIAIGVGLAAAAVVGIVLERGPSCDGGQHHFDGVWDEARKASLQSSIVATQVSFAPEAWERIERNVDAWRETWIAGHRDACEAAQIRGEQSARLMDLRMVCLESRRDRLSAYLALLSEPDAVRLARADEGFAALPPIESCRDPDYVRSQATLPDDPKARASAERLLESLDRASALHDAGDAQSALQITEACVDAAQEAEFPRIAARCHFGLHRDLYALGRFAESRDHAENAYRLARRIDDTEIAAAASRVLVSVTGVMLHQFNEARWWAKVARIEAQRLNDPLVDAQLDVAEARLAFARGDYAGADKLATHALSTIARTDRTTATYAVLLLYTAEIRSYRLDLDGADQACAEALEVFEDIVGSRHPWFLEARTVRADLRRRKGSIALAMEELQDVVRVLENDFGSDHPELLGPLFRLSAGHRSRGDFEAALAVLERAKGLRRPTPIGSDVARYDLDWQQGELFRGMSEPVRSHAAFERSYRERLEALGSENPDTARAQIQFGAALVLIGRSDEGYAEIDEGLTTLGEGLDTNHEDNAHVLEALGAAARARGDTAGYLDHTRRQLEILESLFGPDYPSLGLTHANLCGALANLNRGKEALPHCQQAHRLFATGELRQGDVAGLHNNTGAAFRTAGEPEEAIRHYRAALELWSTAHGDESMQVSIALANIGEIHHEQGRHREALRIYGRAISIREAIAGRDHPALVSPLLGAARAHLSAGRLEQARALAERALEIAERNASDTSRIAEACELLGRISWELPGGRKRARKLGERARELLRARGPSAKEDLARVEAWLATRAPARRTTAQPT